jgi:hypothetical protein
MAVVFGTQGLPNQGIPADRFWEKGWARQEDLGSSDIELEPLPKETVG